MAKFDAYTLNPFVVQQPTNLLAMADMEAQKKAAAEAAKVKAAKEKQEKVLGKMGEFSGAAQLKAGASLREDAVTGLNKYKQGYDLSPEGYQYLDNAKAFSDRVNVLEDQQNEYYKSASSALNNKIFNDNPENKAALNRWADPLAYGNEEDKLNIQARAKELKDRQPWVSDKSALQVAKVDWQEDNKNMLQFAEAWKPDDIITYTTSHVPKIIAETVRKTEKPTDEEGVNEIVRSKVNTEKGRKDALGLTYDSAFGANGSPIRKSIDFAFDNLDDKKGYTNARDWYINEFQDNLKITEYEQTLEGTKAKTSGWGKNEDIDKIVEGVSINMPVEMDYKDDKGNIIKTETQQRQLKTADKGLYLRGNKKIKVEGKSALNKETGMQQEDLRGKNAYFEPKSVVPLYKVTSDKDIKIDVKNPDGTITRRTIKAGTKDNPTFIEEAYYEQYIKQPGAKLDTEIYVDGWIETYKTGDIIEVSGDETKTRQVAEPVKKYSAIMPLSEVESGIYSEYENSEEVIGKYKERLNASKTASTSTKKTITGF